MSVMSAISYVWSLLLIAPGSTHESNNILHIKYMHSTVILIKQIPSYFFTGRVPPPAHDKGVLSSDGYGWLEKAIGAVI